MKIDFREKYKKQAISGMRERFGFDNDLAVPKIKKVVVNVGFGKSVAGKTSDERKKIIKSIVEDLSTICGQKAVLTKAKKSISGFKLRKGLEIGAMVTLRKKKMFDFLERLVNITLPRSRDFSGIRPSSFDGNGNLTLSIKEHIAFAEILPENVKKIFSLEVTVVTSAKNKEQGIALLRFMGFPIKKD